MAAAKKTTKKTPAAVEPLEVQLKIDPASPGEEWPFEDWVKLKSSGQPIFPYRRDADEYIAREYPDFEATQNIPQLLKVLVREVVKGRLG